MKILLTNDDGIHAKGINVLFDALSERYDVYMVAPAEERSACSNAISIRSPLRIRRFDERHFSVDGYPADCTNVGLHGDIVPAPDIVVSGINHGANMGEDIYYSGTVAGARVGFIHGRSGIALSLSSSEKLEFLEDAAAFAAHFIFGNEALLVNEKHFFNINYPARPKTDIHGTAYTSLDKREYRDRFVVKEHNGDEKVVSMDGTVKSERREGSDYDMIKKGYVSITPLTLDSTDYSMIERFSSNRRGNEQ
ncbi:MAG: 5'/3'-nucleotidase SurE [Spirochaetota bacterium]